MNETKTVTTKKVDPTKDVKGFTDNQPSYPTWVVIVGLIVAFIVLKTFIYIKDDKRHGK